MKIEELFGGFKRSSIYHFWVIALLIDVLVKNLWFNTDLIVEGQRPPWFLTGPFFTLIGGTVFLFYLSDMLLEEEDHFFKRWVYNMLQAMLFFVCVGLALDAGLYLMDKEYFCKLQK